MNSLADPTSLAPSRLHPGDLWRVGAIGLLSRKLRATLSALGIAIGIAALVAVLGISESSRAELLSSLDRLGTNLLTVKPSSGIGGGQVALPATSEAMLRRIGPVQQVATSTSVDSTVRRTDLIPPEITGGMTVEAADVGLLGILAGSVVQGRWLDAANSELPVAVLGSVAAQRLGIVDVSVGIRIRLTDHWVTVIGILEPLTFAQNIDRAVLVGRPFAQRVLGTAAAPGTVYLRADPEAINSVRSVVAATANPGHPDQVESSRPSDAIAARAAASNAFTGLFLGLGAVALLVGGVGIANIMVISVVERRAEIGLRRALGATRRQVGIQFLAEALLLSTVGGSAGVLLGVAITAGYDVFQGWRIVVPLAAILGGLAAAIGIGAVAGLYPAIRAAKLAPTEALRTV